MAVNPDSAHLLCEEILAVARTQAEEILAVANREARALLDQAAFQASKAREEEDDRARTEAARRREIVAATIEVEIGRLHSERVEVMLESIYHEAYRRLEMREGFEYRETLVGLASAVIGRTTGDQFVIKISEADRAIFGDGALREILGRAERPAIEVSVAYESDFTGGGIVVEDREARRVWDNRLIKRLERMWPELRRLIAAKVSVIPNAESGGDGP
ncbi:MAG TPA: V-type ATP synthase subunit E family protein [Syntrophorhabdaceae bacterium]|jgi:vacuolar-type H+-ATPase subunit E/Vma4